MTDPGVLALHGEIDFSLGDRLAALLEPLRRPGNEIGAILDLSDVLFADAAFVGVLIGTSKDRAGRTCVLVRRGTLVAKLFEITELDFVFPMFDDVLSAHVYLSSQDRTVATSPLQQAADDGSISPFFSA